MSKFARYILTLFALLLSNYSHATLNNIVVQANGSAGPITVAPSSLVTVVITADVLNDAPSVLPVAWASTIWDFVGDAGNTGCSAQPEPDVVPAPLATLPGTANIGLTAPATPGTYTLVTAAYENAGCAGPIQGLTPVTVNVVLPVVTPVPTVSQWVLILIAIGVSVIGMRKIMRNRLQ
ncbi:MAG: hypothetical protein ABW076_10790 [Candidatus Thiodiazotropha sp.]